MVLRRVKFRKGMQKKFFDRVVAGMSSPSVRGILQFGFDVPYSTLKNYYSGVRLMPEDFFRDLCHLAKTDPDDLGVEFVSGSWGQVIGGRKGKRKKLKSS
ncbi:hypothetical protein HOA55_02310 [archaeon]|jgi:hypothetical protein|nr:hypothetical protein [archaeon]MBT3577616.1 hypothetical protein [archaeon]MBT6820164.1 hypothetical protein [archaeon]MBT7025678.1 hypothetical protein [archaeon]MBT7239323.1 hypothetical protein [archaeon]